MDEAKRRKAIDDMYGMGKLPESARSFVRVMQDMVELQAAKLGTVDEVRKDHQFFLDGVLNGEQGVYVVGIPVELFDFSEYAFTASIQALTGFMGVIRFGMVMYSSETKKSVSPAHDVERGRVIMMLACVDGAWFYNTIDIGEKGSDPIPEIGDWQQGEIKDLTLSAQSRQFVKAITETLKKSQTLRDNVKAVMTLGYLKEHYRAAVSAPMKKNAGGEASIN